MSRYAGIAANREAYRQIFGRMAVDRPGEEKLPLPEREEEAPAALRAGPVDLPDRAERAGASFEGISPGDWERGPTTAQSDLEGGLEQLFRALEREGRLGPQDLQGEENG